MDKDVARQSISKPVSAIPTDQEVADFFLPSNGESVIPGNGEVSFFALGQSGILTGAELTDPLDRFLATCEPTAATTDSLMPVQDLPSQYRKAIDKGVSTGWRSLDRLMQGIRKGELTVITADTGVGKTTFATQLLVNCAVQGVPVWLNSWEMRPETTIRKLASIVLRKPMKFEAFTMDDTVAFDSWAMDHDVYINPKTIGTNIDQLAIELVRAKSLGIRVVMLDHLDYLVRDNRDKLHEAIDATVKRLHELALGLDMHLLLIVHPRQLSSATDEVGIHSLKGSASIKQYADNILVLHRCSRTDSQADPSKTRIRVVKNRMFGTEGTTYLYYAPLWDGYVELKDE